MADCADTVGLSQQLFRNLRLPMKQGSSWHLSDQPLLPLPEVSLRNYVGRWRIASSADKYLRTAKRVIQECRNNS